MRTLFNLIKFIVIIAILVGVVLLGTNKTFLYTKYNTKDMYGDGIPISRFMYYLEEKNNIVKFVTPIGISTLNSEKDEYLSKLKHCYGKYYYDEGNNITISEYYITEKNHYNSVSFKYEYLNRCSEDYVLSDMWVYEYNDLSTFVGGDITEKAMIKFIKDIYEEKRVEDPKITEYKSKIKINIDCHMSKYDYKLSLEDFSENEIKITKTYEDRTMFAVYTMDNALEYLESLEKA